MPYIHGAYRTLVVPTLQRLSCISQHRLPARIDGWQCYEGPGVQPYWTGDAAKEDAIGYATARAKFGRGEIRVLDNAGEVERVIPFDQTEK